jgi:hypothetical protein
MKRAVGGKRGDFDAVGKPTCKDSKERNASRIEGEQLWVV